MADNYIEKKMEEHQKSSIKKIKTIKKTSAVFITDGLSSEGSKLVKEYATNAEIAVAFSGISVKEGRLLAQATGSRFYLLTPYLTLDDAIADAKAHYFPLQVKIINP